MIRNNLRKIGEALDYNPAIIAEGTGLPYNTVYRIWNNSVVRVEFDTIDKLCTFLNVPSGELFEHVPDDEMTPEDIEHLKERVEELEKYRSYRKSNKKEE